MLMASSGLIPKTIKRFCLVEIQKPLAERYCSSRVTTLLSHGQCCGATLNQNSRTSNLNYQYLRKLNQLLEAKLRQLPISHSNLEEQNHQKFQAGAAIGVRIPLNLHF